LDSSAPEYIQKGKKRDPEAEIPITKRPTAIKRDVLEGREKLNCKESSLELCMGVGTFKSTYQPKKELRSNSLLT